MDTLVDVDTLDEAELEVEVDTLHVKNHGHYGIKTEF